MPGTTAPNATPRMVRRSRLPGLSFADRRVATTCQPRPRRRPARPPQPRSPRTRPARSRRRRTPASPWPTRRRRWPRRRAMGVTAAALCADLGWPAETLDAARDSLTVAEYIALLGAGDRLAGDPVFGLHAGLHARLSTYPFYGLVVCACTTLRAAFAQTHRYEGLAHDLGRSRLDERGGIATYYWDTPWLAAARPPRRATCATACWPASSPSSAGSRTSACRCTRSACPTPSPMPRSAPRTPRCSAPPWSTACRPPTAASTPRCSTARCPTPTAACSRCCSATPTNCSPRACARPPSRASSPTCGARWPPSSPTTAPASTTSPPRWPLSTRTLQRKLAEAGTNFQAVHDAARQALAEELLRDSQLNLTDVAFMLGYREQSSFNRACRDWFGEHAGADARAAARGGQRGLSGRRLRDASRSRSRHRRSDGASLRPAS